MAQPSILHLTTWENRKRDIFTVIREALRILCQSPNLPEIEDSPTQHNLNRQLAKDCFGKAVYRNGFPDGLKPIYNGQNPPYRADVERHPRENKKPDFYWQFIDHTVDEDSCERYFFVECKRLGHQSSRNWTLNENYVNDGIQRFITTPHEYGKGEDACGMIGYVQSMAFDDILREVNLAIVNNSEAISPLLSPSNNWQENDVSELEHELIRPFPLSPFRMYHFWVDIRSSY